jgi:hypothetical protein
MEIPNNLNWIEVKTAADLLTVNKLYWCRLHDGHITRIVWYDGNWRSWARFQNPDVSPFAQVAAYAPYVCQSPKTIEERREYNRKRQREAKERRERERAEWIAAGCPKRKLLSRKSLHP